VGIPLALANYQLLPFWGTLLREIGLNIVASPVSTAEIIRSGVEATLSTPCFPVKVAYGHVLHLIEQGVDYLWAPSVLNMPRNGTDSRHSALCPYVSALPYGVAALVEQRGGSVKMLQPKIPFQEGRRGIMESLKPLAKELGVTPRQLRRAVDRAWQSQDAFEEACRDRGRKAMEELAPGQKAAVIVSRPYNACDSGAYLRLPAKLRKLGLLAIPMDFLDLRRSGPTGDRVLDNMYWKYGQHILHAADVIRSDPRLHAVYLSSFSCGPDSFLIGYFKRLMAPKPSLVLEIDEHSADAGVLTRLEAFLDSLNASPPCAPPPRSPLYPRSTDGSPRRTLYVPWMGDQAYGLAAAIRAYGQPAEVIPVADSRSLELGRRACSGKECLPCIITAGDMIRLVQRPDFDPSRAAFFMPGGSGPCRFGQYNCLHKLLLKEMGLGEVSMAAPAHDTAFYEDWHKFRRGTLSLVWRSLCAFNLLQEARLTIRPYETRRGATDEAYKRWGRRLCELIERRPREAELIAALAQAAAEFAAIPVDRRRRRPRIGVVGEIYVRHHDFANGDLLRQLESLGAETTLSGYPEWHYYTNWMRITDARRARHWRRWLVSRLYDHAQHRMERRLNAAFQPLLGRVDEPRTAELLELAKPYLDPSLKGGEAVLSVGKILDMAHRGCHGAINVMPFSCMPSTIVDGVMKRLAASIGRMPVLSISYDGQQDPALQTRLEAFLHQARTYQAERSRTPTGCHARVAPRWGADYSGH
jgi:predicted nucleotide-binding protein (sugar kinase/HSP70/actin superfamily)